MDKKTTLDQAAAVEMHRAECYRVCRETARALLVCMERLAAVTGDFNNICHNLMVLHRNDPTVIALAQQLYLCNAALGAVVPALPQTFGVAGDSIVDIIEQWQKGMKDRALGKNDPATGDSGAGTEESGGEVESAPSSAAAPSDAPSLILRP